MAERQNILHGLVYSMFGPSANLFVNLMQKGTHVAQIHNNIITQLCAISIIILMATLDLLSTHYSAVSVLLV